MTQLHDNQVPVVTRPQRFGALAWTALILGIVGLMGSPIIFFNNLTAIAAGVGVILGVIAFFGTKKILAAIGTILCVGAIVVTVSVQSTFVEKLDEIVQGTTSPQVTPLSWGQRHTWDDGLAVEIATPIACTPGEYAQPPNVARATKITVTVLNGTDKPFDTATLTVGSDAQFNGKRAEQIFDTDGGCGGGFEATTILPGKTYTYEAAYSVTAETGELQITLQPSFTAPKSIFTGQA
ncbi:hypothetical protein GCM10022243_06130 [Saccharothrix violaceirubra]|uniref:DUF4352 domain-containing protein n=1 Tax=Saccharothrix violaceirubra TaxID=413306 RepID=A0A7W7SY13_9PSEU|nr:hypothetical protein [Saccharothrix violaceirubra]MBB4963024.1 hypothetical protein [Saccharothrix violaceirubra]